MHCTGSNDCTKLKQSFSGMDVIVLMCFYGFYPGLKLPFQNHSYRKNQFLSGCYCLYERYFYIRWPSFFTMLESLAIETGTWNFPLFAPKTFNHSKNTWCCWNGDSLYWQRTWLMLQGWTKSNYSLLCHRSTLLFCLYVKLFLSSIFKHVDFLSSMSCIVLDIGHADIIVF